MTDQQHPITPPPELFKQWEGMPRSLAFEAAYRAGADQELEECCEWLERNSGRWELPAGLRAARRQKPPSLVEQALQAINDERAELALVNYHTILAALKRLQKLEGHS